MKTKPKRRPIEVIVNFWDPVELGKKLCFLTKTAICSSEKVFKEIFQYPSFYDFNFFLGVQKIKLQKLGPGSSAIDAGGS
jgi:hypothetical protein